MLPRLNTIVLSVDMDGAERAGLVYTAWGCPRHAGPVSWGACVQDRSLCKGSNDLRPATIRAWNMEVWWSGTCAHLPVAGRCYVSGRTPLWDAMYNALILIIEDEPEIADILRGYLDREGFRTVCAADGNTGIAHHLRLKPDLVLLDVKLPGPDGFDVLAAIRRQGETPVIMVTALGEDLDKLQALRIGADDYVVKPFNPLEVVARTKAVLRRTNAALADKVLRVGSLVVDATAHQAYVTSATGNLALDLTRTEFRLLEHMAHFPRRAFERSELVDACLPEGDALERTVDSHMSNLRRKLASAGAGELLSGVRGVGYRLGTVNG